MSKSPLYANIWAESSRKRGQQCESSQREQLEVFKNSMVPLLLEPSEEQMKSEKYRP